jgi:hypothetical protein
MCPEASSKVCHDSFCQSDSNVSLPWVIYYEAFCLHAVSSFSCIPVICPKLELFLTKIVIDKKIIEQVKSFNYLGNMIPYERELDIDSKLNNHLKITGILNNLFTPQNNPLRKPE